jgi:hypothetical protein
MRTHNPNPRRLRLAHRLNLYSRPPAAKTVEGARVCPQGAEATVSLEVTSGPSPDLEPKK